MLGDAPGVETGGVWAANARLPARRGFASPWRRWQGARPRRSSWEEAQLPSSDGSATQPAGQGGEAAAHKETEHYKRWRERVAEWMVEPRQGIVYTGIRP
jgi:hypothetical protein